MYIECEIPSLKLVVELIPNTSVEEERLLYLMQLNEICCDVSLIIETRKSVSKLNMTSMSNHVFFLRVIWFFFMNKIMTY
jgi:hypothetical protein